jgi:hypothetical protein
MCQVGSGRVYTGKAPLSSSLSLSLALALILALAPSAAGRAPPAPALLGLGDVPPPWPATWQLNMSTAIMPANYNGFTYNVSQWGYVDFDWFVLPGRSTVVAVG